MLVKDSRQVERLLRERQPALVITKGFPAHYTGGLSARRAGIPCLWHLQDQISERYGGIYRRFFAWTAGRLPDFIVADGSPILEQLPASLRERSRVVLNGIDTEVFKPALQPGLYDRAVRDQFGIPQAALLVGHAARLTPWKGQHHLLEAFIRIAGRFPQAHLMLVGSALFDKDDYAKSLQQRAVASGFAERIHFTGYRHDLAHVLAGMDLFVYPSVEKDTSPLALLSAMACGLPVIAFDIPGVNEVVGKAGFLVVNRDEAALAAEMARMLENPSRRERFGQASRQAALERFSLEAHTRQMEEAFHHTINKFKERKPDHR
jgi:glycosyltransferase involved in cell wall biosynthesis